MGASNVNTMREALLKLDKWLYIGADGRVHGLHDKTGEIERTIKAALSSPQRNCDRLFNSETAIESYQKETGLNECPIQLWTAPRIYAFIDWLLSPATERKVEGDGSK